MMSAQYANLCQGHTCHAGSRFRGEGGDGPEVSRERLGRDFRSSCCRGMDVLSLQVIERRWINPFHGDKI